MSTHWKQRYPYGSNVLDKELNEERYPHYVREMLDVFMYAYCFFFPKSMYVLLVYCFTCYKSVTVILKPKIEVQYFYTVFQYLFCEHCLPVFHILDSVWACEESWDYYRALAELGIAGACDSLGYWLILRSIKIIVKQLFNHYKIVRKLPILNFLGWEKSCSACEGEVLRLSEGFVLIIFWNSRLLVWIS